MSEKENPVLQKSRRPGSLASASERMSNKEKEERRKVNEDPNYRPPTKMERTTSEDKALSKSAPVAYRKKRQKAEKGKIKIAVLATGRWQPPHVGHVVIINKAYEIAEQERGHAFVFVCGKPVRKDSSGKIRSLTDIEKNANPLNIDQKLKYLKKMFPRQQYPALPVGLEFLTTESFDFKNFGPKEYRTQMIRKVKMGSGFTGITSYLKSRNYKKIIILAGSDRFNLFKKLNAQYIESGLMEIEKVGEERGASGSGKITMGICDLNNKECTEHLDQALMRYYEDEISRGQVTTYSGTNMRNFARNGNIVQFIVGSKIGNMTNNDCLDLMNDIRNGSVPALPALTDINMTQALFRVNKDWKIRAQYHDNPDHLRDLALAGDIDPIYNSVEPCGIPGCAVHVAGGKPGWKEYDDSENPFLHGTKIGGVRRTRKRRKRKRRKKTTRKRKRKKTTKRRRFKKRRRKTKRRN